MHNSNTNLKAIAKTENFIVLNEYKSQRERAESYQSEADLESELIRDLKALGYEYVQIKDNDAMFANVRKHLEALNEVQFSDEEWERFLEEYLNCANDTLIDKTRKIHEDYVYTFTFDDGRLRNIKLLDKKNILRNRLQVLNQFEQTGKCKNRYDVTILVNGLPLVQIELKRRGVAIREAFNQIHRYTKESFNHKNSLFKFLQLFIISNGTDTKYFANTTKRDKHSFDFTINWAKSNNELIKDLKDFTDTFLQQHTLLNVLINYCVFDTTNTLLILRPYQIAGVERILWKIKHTYNTKNWSKPESGGFIWHTTGSGKTLTSFKVARLATELPFIKKVFFVVDRKDLDYQTMQEYQKFSKDSVNGSESTAGLKENLDKEDNRIVVTTIQKLNNLMKAENDLPIYKEPVVFIFDECHRSQFGEAQKNLKKKFKIFCQFGFTGTPILAENSLSGETTESVFGKCLHSYVITHAIRDEKVLKFKVDYNDVRPEFKQLETEQDLEKLNSTEMRKALMHPARINEITQYILRNFDNKTHRLNCSLNPNQQAFNAMFAVESVKMAMAYYESFKQHQAGVENPLKVATIFSFKANEEQNAQGEISDESFDVNAMDRSEKEFLESVINDYNQMFQTSFSLNSKDFQNYYRDLSQRVKNQEVDLLIVVGMFLTGFDAPALNTLFVDKNLRYHGLIQAFSRTNRIFNSTKSFGNIVTFRDLEKATIDAIKLFGEDRTDNSANALRQIILERKFDDYMYGYTDKNNQHRRGFVEIVQELNQRFPNPAEIASEQEKKEFVELFGEYLRMENILQNYDEFHELKKSLGEKNLIQEPEATYTVEGKIAEVAFLSERENQDYRSAYNDIREQRQRASQNEQALQSQINWDNVVFEVDLLKSQDIDFDYILGLIFEKNQKDRKNIDPNHPSFAEIEAEQKTSLIDYAQRLIRSSIENRPKESLVVDFLKVSDLFSFKNKEDLLDKFFSFARQVRTKELKELVDEEQLNFEKAEHYIESSLKRGYVSDDGTDLKYILPSMSPLNKNYKTIRQRVYQKFCDFVNKFKGIGGEI